MLELDLATRRSTGNVRLIVIPAASKAVLEQHIEAHVLRGSLVFTDSHKSYTWLKKSSSGFVHRAINHKRREFSRVESIFGVNVNVSTNATEGLFGRLKTFARERSLKRVPKECYGLVLTEYLWREYKMGPLSCWHGAGMWPLAETLAKFDRANGVAIPQTPYKAPVEFEHECIAVKEASKVIPAAHIAHVAAPLEAVPPAAAAPAALRIWPRMRLRGQQRSRAEILDVLEGATSHIATTSNLSFQRRQR